MLGYSLKYLHICGVIMWLGTAIIFPILTVVAVKGKDRKVGWYYAAVSVRMKQILVLPGLAIVLMTGILMSYTSQLGFFRWSWLGIAQTISVFLTINTLYLYLLMVRQRSLANPKGEDRFHGIEGKRLRQKIMVFGMANIMGILTVMWFMVTKP